jgi:hypothetical protein
LGGVEVFGHRGQFAADGVEQLVELGGVHGVGVGLVVGDASDKAWPSIRAGSIMCGAVIASSNTPWPRSCDRRSVRPPLQ